MKVTITAKKLNISQAFTDYAEQKLDAKLDRFFPEEAEAKITLSERRDQIVLELTVSCGGMIYRAEETARDKNDALDVTVDRIIRQIRKHKTKVEKNLRENAFAGLAPEPEETDYEVIRYKNFHMKPMSVEEAILQMNLLGHNFFMFKNAQSGTVNVVYKRDEGNYAVLVPEEN
ncbi:MAG: ribosome-associated translation inhibitor RaiA [Oscillospiraceae bacterium]|nr:ribosome-associated translation inhibitor RaiA [Oscillospiraceae bacterium]MCH5208768.1 ribosome-associated translation inhibitor RaiA [Oscillospiraceae bacterium]